MDAEPPQSADRHGGDRRKARRAFWFAGAGVVAGLTIAIVSALGEISGKQAVIMGLPAAVLALGGLAVAVAPDPETAERQGFQAGLRTGWLIRRWRSVFGRRGSGGP